MGAESGRAAAEGEVPTGCVIVDGDGEVAASAHNRTESAGDASQHAEMLALKEAFRRNGNWRLQGHTLFVTKEPCPMCAGAIVLSRVDRVVWGVSDPKRGGGSVFGIFDHPGINHHPETASGVMEEPCRKILQDFFRKRREK
jgi:tRNA(adenine34) deaminase